MLRITIKKLQPLDIPKTKLEMGLQYHFHLNGRSGPLTFSRACQESLLIRRDGTHPAPRQAR
jgi:hypothetical protein